MSINSKLLGVFIFQCIPTVVCLGKCNSVNIYPIITYLIYLKANFLLYKTQLSPNPAWSTLSPRRDTFNSESGS